jgi:hypothetical protein
MTGVREAQEETYEVNGDESKSASELFGKEIEKSENKSEKTEE